jgi:hypothetical protein
MPHQSINGHKRSTDQYNGQSTTVIDLETLSLLIPEFLKSSSRNQVDSIQSYPYAHAFDGSISTGNSGINCINDEQLHNINVCSQSMTRQLNPPCHLLLENHSLFHINGRSEFSLYTITEEINESETMGESTIFSSVPETSPVGDHGRSRVIPNSYSSCHADDEKSASTQETLKITNCQRKNSTNQSNPPSIAEVNVLSSISDKEDGNLSLKSVVDLQQGFSCDWLWQENCCLELWNKFFPATFVNPFRASQQQDTLNLPSLRVLHEEIYGSRNEEDLHTVADEKRESDMSEEKVGFETEERHHDYIDSNLSVNEGIELTCSDVQAGLREEPDTRNFRLNLDMKDTTTEEEEKRLPLPCKAQGMKEEIKPKIMRKKFLGRRVVSLPCVKTS